MRYGKKERGVFRDGWRWVFVFREGYRYRGRGGIEGYFELRDWVQREGGVERDYGGVSIIYR